MNSECKSVRKCSNVLNWKLQATACSARLAFLMPKKSNLILKGQGALDQCGEDLTSMPYAHDVRIT